MAANSSGVLATTSVYRKIQTPFTPNGTLFTARRIVNRVTIHTGIGVVREYGLTLHTKMSRSLYHCLGAPKAHRKRLESVLELVPAS